MGKLASSRRRDISVEQEKNIKRGGQQERRRIESEGIDKNNMKNENDLENRIRDRIRAEEKEETLKLEQERLESEKGAKEWNGTYQKGRTV